MPQGPLVCRGEAHQPRKARGRDPLLPETLDSPSLTDAETVDEHHKHDERDRAEGHNPDQIPLRGRGPDRSGVLSLNGAPSIIYIAFVTSMRPAGAKITPPRRCLTIMAPH